MYGLVDCNNFYCSCERLFNPGLIGKPIVVLSNNDGCIIARSDEAKALGIAMGTPHYMLRKDLERWGVKVFSSNYTLYGDISDRVMETLSAFTPELEIYSIDEAFLDFRNRPYENFKETCREIRQLIARDIGIPVSVGVASTRTLAKMANRYAKKVEKAAGYFCANESALEQSMLLQTPVDAVWGVGHQHAIFLRKKGFDTAYKLSKAPDNWMRDQLSVVGLRLLNELRGISSLPKEKPNEPRERICVSRAFGVRIIAKEAIAEALANYAASCAEKLRAQKSCCTKLQVFVHTNPHKTGEQQYQRTITVALERPSNHTGELLKAALSGLDRIFKQGYTYMKTGLVVMDLVPESAVQTSVFASDEPKKNRRLMASMDAINQSLGKETVRMATQGFVKAYRMRADHLSPCYTTRIDHIVKVRI